ncbi:MAG: calcium/sodium antiporter [Chloroflexi bacterium]|nr:calcium/sodium antiporter [Chloroflexota bacterium]
MALTLVLFAAGIALLFKGSDYFVESSLAIARRAGLPRVVVGGTLVSLATTSPELTVSILAGVEGVPGLAVGNALGSVAANIGVIMALAAIVRPFDLPDRDFRGRCQVMVGLAVLLFIMILDLGLPRWRGFLLVAIGIGYVVLDYRRARKRRGGRRLDETHAGMTNPGSGRRIALFFLLGAAMVVSGSQLLVSSGTAIAAALGVPRVFIGLTLVAMGTSLPELATAIAAVRKREFELSAGNLIGANILNLTLVTGAAAALSPVTLAPTAREYTFPAILVLLGVFFLLARSRKRLARGEGVLLIALYVAFLAGLSILNIQ